MGRLILDTSVLIALHRRTTAWEAVGDDGDDLAVAAISAAELLQGTQLGDPQHRHVRVAQVEEDIARMPVEPYDLDVARVHADLLVATTRSGRKRQAHDLIIAATARATNRTVVTLDRSGFDDLPGVSVRAAA